MGRIYFEKTENKLVEGDTKESPAKEYFQKVASLIPSEIIAAYLTIVGLIPLIGNKKIEFWFFYGSMGTCTLLTYWYMKKQTPKNPPYTPTANYVLSVIAFIIWAYATTGDKAPGLYYNSAIASIVLILFSLISGLIPLR